MVVAGHAVLLHGLLLASIGELIPCLARVRELLLLLSPRMLASTTLKLPTLLLLLLLASILRKLSILLLAGRVRKLVLRRSRPLSVLTPAELVSLGGWGVHLALTLTLTLARGLSLLEISLSTILLLAYRKQQSR